MARDGFRRVAVAVAVLAAYPAGGVVRAAVDTVTGPRYPHITTPSSPLVDADPAEAFLNRFIVSTDRPAEALGEESAVEEAIQVSPGRVALATTKGRRHVAALRGVTDVDVDPPRAIATADPLFVRQWGLHNTGQAAPSVGKPGADIRWQDSRGHADGTGVVVAVTDSGVDFSHPDLAHLLWTNPDEICGNGLDDDRNGYTDDCHGYDFVNRDGEQFDTHKRDGTPADNSHGTHVAGVIAAAVDNGVGIAGIAPGVKIMPLKIFEGGTFPTSRGLEAINYAVANGATVINASWGSSRGTTFDERNTMVNASNKGVIIAAAAGNVATDNDVTPFYPASHDVPGLISVAASTSTDAHASFSCFGAKRVALHAPGSWVLSTVPGGYAYMSGTSMAAPHVAGAVALLRSYQPALSVAGIRAALLDSADKVAAFGGLTESGGRLDAANLLGITDTGVDFSFERFDGFRPGEEHTALVRLKDAGGSLPPGAQLAVQGTLALVDGGWPRGVIGHRVNETDTDLDAQVPLTGTLSAAQREDLAQAGLSLPVTTTLPVGHYALLVEFVDRSRAGSPAVGAPRAVLFTVGDPAAVPPAPAPQPAPTTPPSAPPPPGTAPTPAPTAPPVDGWLPPGTPPPTGGPILPPGTAPAPPGTTPAPPGGDIGLPPGVAPPDGGVPPLPEPGGPRDPGAPPPATDGQPPPPPGSPGQPRPEPTEPHAPIAPPSAPAPPPVPGKDKPPPVIGDHHVFPNSGSTAGGTVVTVDMSHPPVDPYVRFGDSNGVSVTAMDGFGIRVTTPPHVAGTVDVTVIARDGTETVLRDAFTFVAPTPAPAPPRTSPPPGDTSPPPAPAPPSPYARTVRRPYTAANGLRVDTFLDGHPLMRISLRAWDGHGCRTSPCAGVAL